MRFSERLVRTAMGVAARFIFLFRSTPKVSETELGKARSFFLFRPEGLGDILLTLAAIAYLREVNPSARIAMAVLPQFTEFLSDLRVVDEVVSFEYPRRKDFSLALLWRLVRRVYSMRNRYDIAYDFRGDERNAMICAWAAPIAIGQVSRGTSFLLSATQPPSFTFSRAIHNLNVVSAPAAVRPDIRDFDKGYDYEMATDVFLRATKMLNGWASFIILHPGASRISNFWSAANWQELARRLISDNHRLVFTGVPGIEARVVGEIIAGIDDAEDNVLNLAGKTSCSELAALVEMATALVSPDTGIAHVAHAVGTPSVTLFGPGSELTGGYLTPINKPVFVSLWCRPCRKAVCPRKDVPGECMSAITVEEVHAHLLSALSARSMLRRTRSRAPGMVAERPLSQKHSASRVST